MSKNVSVKVVCRFRPLNAMEKKKKKMIKKEIYNKNTSIKVIPEVRFLI